MTPDPSTSAILNIPLDQIEPGANDRTTFAEQPLRELAASIAQDGLAQPITVRPIGGNRYSIVAGERRFRAVRLLEHVMIPAIVRTLTDDEASRIMLVENLSRVDLDPLEEAKGYRSRMERFGITDVEVAQWASIGVERVRARLDLLTLRDDIQAMVASGQLSPTHARCMVGLDSNRQGLVIQWLNTLDGLPTAATMRQRAGVLREQQYDEQGELSMRIEDWTPPAEDAHLPMGKASSKLSTEIPHADSRMPGFRRASTVYDGLRNYQDRLIELGLQAEAEVVGTVILGLLRADLMSTDGKRSRG